MIFPRTRLFFISWYGFPFLELYVYILIVLSHNVDKHQSIVHVILLVLTSKAVDSIVFYLVSELIFKLIGMDDFMSWYLLMTIWVVFYAKEEGIWEISSRKSDEVKLLGELLFFIYTSVYHYGTPKDCGSMVL